MSGAGSRLQKALFLLALLLKVFAEVVPGELESGILSPDEPVHLQVGTGRTKFIQFSCLGGPANVVISLTTYSQHSDPLLLLSLNPDDPPSLQDFDSSSFDQWQQDDADGHFVTAKGVGPRGGILGVFNIRHFAEQDLHCNIDMRCSYIVAFDFVFWDHLTDRSICPIGKFQNSNVWCSGNGQCSRHGTCICYDDFTGPACESAKTDVMVLAHGRYDFSVDSGRYRYFRIRVPPEFRGGFLEINLQSELPLVVVAMKHTLPTKANYELSNFADWLEGANKSTMQFPVPGNGGEQLTQGVGTSRRIAAADAPVCVSNAHSHPQPWSTAPGCETEEVKTCENTCMECIKCVNGVDASDGGHCSTCEDCRHDCAPVLARCGSHIKCRGPEAQQCEVDCGGCMSCVRSNDQHCTECECCRGCLPWAAQCGMLSPEPQASMSQFVFVGVYNHRKYYNERTQIHATVDISLEADTSFKLSNTEKSWTAELYNPFQTVEKLQEVNQLYPAGREFVYQFKIHGFQTYKKKVNLFRDRATLIHVWNTALRHNTELKFSKDKSTLSHVLSSTRALPKTLFDFDQVHASSAGKVKIRSKEVDTVWLALFANQDDTVEITVRTFDDPPAESVPLGFAVLCVFGLLCGLLLLALLYGGALKYGRGRQHGVSSENNSQGGSRPSGLRDFLRSASHMEVTNPLTRGESWGADDDFDRRVEERYMQRGGFGDDGI